MLLSAMLWGGTADVAFSCHCGEGLLMSLSAAQSRATADAAVSCTVVRACFRCVSSTE
jgi:hypothetical protein